VVVLLCALVLGGWCFRGVLFRGELFAFRDAGHYYAPLYRFVHQQWAAGRVPLWNPYENLGQPLAADPTAAVFYPGKLVFALVPSWDWAWRVYVLAHLGLALWGAYVLARRLGAGVEAAGAGALSYAFSGSVLFQYCNVPYLVGAAWLPPALWAVDRMYGGPARQRGGSLSSPASTPVGKHAAPGHSWWHSTLGPMLGLATVLSMMTLGGDPQMAYHVVLLAVLYLVFLPARLRDATAPSEAPTEPQHRAAPAGMAPGRLRLVVALAGAVVLAGLSSAVQILPAVELSGLSSRDPGPWSERLLARGQPNTHAEHTYHFSVGPWRFAELFWPHVGGRQLPVHRRWFEAIPAEGRVWTPSLYFGVVPLVLALGAMRWRRRTQAGREPSTGGLAAVRRRWLTWTALLALVGSLGWYGPGWIVHEIRTACGADPEHWLVGAPFGGLYWLMTLALPGYARFRYPAKLLVVATLGLSMLGALGWERMISRPSARVLRWLKRIAVLSLLLAGAALLARPFWPGLLAGTRPDVLFGPLDAAGAWEDMFRGLVHAALVCALFWRMGTWLAHTPAARPAPTDSGSARSVSSSAGSWVWRLGLVVLAVDLAAANGWLVVGAPAGLWQQQSRLGRVIAEHEARRAAPDSAGWPVLERERSPGASRTPEAGPSTSAAGTDSERREFVCVWRQPIFLPEHWQQSSSPERVTEEVAWDRDTLFPKHNLGSRIRVLGVRGAFVVASVEPLLADRSAAQSLAAWVILPRALRQEDAERIETDVPDVSLWYQPEHLPHAWIEHPSGDARGGSRLDSPSLTALGPPAAQTLPGEWCRVVAETEECVELEARLLRPGLVVLADQHFPGWCVGVETEGQATHEAQIVPVHGALRGVWLGPGGYRLVYRYRPASVLIGGVLSGLGWLGAGVLLVIGLVRRRSNSLVARNR